MNFENLQFENHRSNFTYKDIGSINKICKSIFDQFINSSNYIEEDIVEYRYSGKKIIYEKIKVNDDGYESFTYWVNFIVGLNANEIREKRNQKS